MGFLDDYEPVEERLARFWDEHEAGRVHTDLVHHGGGEWVVRAEVYREASDDTPMASGYAHEVTGQGNVNQTSALENCETSAIGRALANAGYAPKGQRPSREEMAKTQRPPQQSSDGPSDGQIRAAHAKYKALPEDAQQRFQAWCKAEGIGAPEQQSKAQIRKALDKLTELGA